MLILKCGRHGLLFMTLGCSPTLEVIHLPGDMSHVSA